MSKHLDNPWKEIKLSDYEGHMNLESVKQLPVLRAILKAQLEDYGVKSAMIFGVAGGAGLENIVLGQFEKIYGVDINEGFLADCKERFENLQPMLELVNVDLMDDECQLPKSDLVICNLVAEYIGYEALLNSVAKVGAKIASVVIQVNRENNFVSDSPYLKRFERLDEVHCLMEEDVLVSKFKCANYSQINRKSWELPNGKLLVRLDFKLNIC